LRRKKEKLKRKLLLLLEKAPRGLVSVTIETSQLRGYLHVSLSLQALQLMKEGG
jgi:hypothetical protein